MFVAPNHAWLNLDGFFKRWVLFTKNLVSVPWAGINMRLYREKCLLFQQILLHY
jgi:hypothetical protein